MKHNMIEMCAAARNKWSDPVQLFRAVGEMGELLSALDQFFNCGRGSAQDVMEEIADVTVVLETLKQITSDAGGDFDLALETKLAKFAKHLDREGTGHF